MVSQTIKDCVGQVAPVKHQFLPFEFVWKNNGSHAADYFWFYACVRIDVMGPDYSNFQLMEGGYFWDTGSPTKDGQKGRFVVNLERVGDNHVRMDPRVGNSFNFPYISGALKRALDAAETRGIGYHAAPSV